MKGQNKLFIAILIGLFLGVLIGAIVHYQFVDYQKDFSQNIKLLGTIFIRMIQMIIAPLIFSTLIVGVAKMSDIRMIGRVGSKAMLWFFTASLVSLFIGLIFVNWLEPGRIIHISINEASSSQEIINHSEGFSLESFIKHMIPKSIFEAFSGNEILQIVVFSIIFGIALSQLDEKQSKPLIHILDIVSHTILKMVGYIMWLAPIGVLGSIASIVSTDGFGIFKIYLFYMIDFIIALSVLWIVLCIVGYFILGKRLFSLIKKIKEPLLIAFSTTSSEAVFPKLISELKEFGCNEKIISFVLPLGYSFNLDGSMMYTTFASIFIAQVYGVEMTLSEQITMLLVLMLTSKGIAGIPRAALVIIVATGSMFKIPPAGVALLLPIDHFCDMGRSIINVLGNALSTSAICKWEGELKEEN